MKFWKVLVLTLMSTLILKSAPNDVISEGLAIPISQKGFDLIVYYEVSGSKSTYDRSYARPMVPAWQTTASGVTVGWGLDLGHLSKDQIRTAMMGVVGENDIILLQSVSGMKGRNAYYNGLPKVRNKIVITWDQAEQIFRRYTLPSFARQTANAFMISPERLHPHTNGALISLVYNRGPSLALTESRKEMRWIKYNISINREDRIPSDIKSMKRLWSYSKLKGLHLRRDAEAKLAEEGIILNRK